MACPSGPMVRVQALATNDVYNAFMKCIYCLRDLGADAFNTEHVVPKAFGTFEQNLTLNDVVCKDCNSHLGNSLELFFARDSIEAYDRVRQGLKRVENFVKFRKDRLIFSLAEEGEWCGLRLRLRPEADGHVVSLVPQVGFQSKGNPDWIYMTEEELKNPENQLPREISDEGIRIIGLSDDKEEQLGKILRDRGINFQKKGEWSLPKAETGDIEFFINTKIDPVIKRCTAKIVFNYLAYTAGRDFVLHEDFNVTRDYIRFGKSPGFPLVDANDTPILANDSRTLRQTEGHLITVNWTADKRRIVGRLSLFNRVTYRITLARYFSGLWRPIRSGHHFDLETRKIGELSATSLIVP